MNSIELLSCLPQLLDERLTALEIPHGELELISSNMNYVFTDYEHVLCKVQGPMALGANRVEKEISLSQYMEKWVPTTRPAYDKPFEVGGLVAGVWIYCKGLTKNEAELTVADIKLVLDNISAIHRIPINKNLKVITLSEAVSSLAKITKSYPIQDNFEKLLVELVNEYEGRFIETRNNEAKVLLHGDAHLGNFIFGDKLTVCDLESVMVGEREHDLGVLLYLCDRKGASDSVLEAIKEHIHKSKLDPARVVLFARIKAVQGLMDNIAWGHYSKLPDRLHAFAHSRFERLLM
jgi:thiamine kinase-like enzyme